MFGEISCTWNITQCENPYWLKKDVGGGGVTGFKAVQHAKQDSEYRPDFYAQVGSPGCTTRFASAFTIIITNQPKVEGAPPLPHPLVCRRHIPEPAGGEKVRGSVEDRGDCKTEFPERFVQGGGGWREGGSSHWRAEAPPVLCHSGLVGASGAIWTPASV